MYRVQGLGSSIAHGMCKFLKMEGFDPEGHVGLMGNSEGSL